MKMMSSLVITLSLLLSLPASGDDIEIVDSTKIIEVAADPWPPFIDPQHPKGGLSLEIIRAAYKTQGYDIHYTNVPWARAKIGVENGIYDILPDVWKNTARKHNLRFSRPYAKNMIKFIALKDSSFEFNGLESLDGLVVGTVMGYGYNEEFDNSTAYKKENASDFMQNIRKLMLRRIDLTVEDEIVARNRISRESPALFDKLRFLEPPLSEQKLYIAAGYKNSRYKEIIDAFDRGLAIIIEDGTFAEILSHYSLSADVIPLLDAN